MCELPAKGGRSSLTVLDDGRFIFVPLRIQGVPFLRERDIPRLGRWRRVRGEVHANADTG